MFCHNLDNCDLCQCDVLGTCRVKYKQKDEDEDIHHSLKNKCECGCSYFTIDNFDYCVCTNCEYRWR